MYILQYIIIIMIILFNTIRIKTDTIFPCCSCGNPFTVAPLHIISCSPRIFCSRVIYPTQNKSTNPIIIGRRVNIIGRGPIRNVVISNDDLVMHYLICSPVGWTTTTEPFRESNRRLLLLLIPLYTHGTRTVIKLPHPPPPLHR